MSYQVLARKYRPRSFDTLVGQEHVVRALTHALDQKRLHHAWLFTGTRGVGKTTLARILAKSLNCQGADGQGDVTAQPCGVCEACNAIDAGRFVDYIEMDAASNRGVDEMAQLLEQAIYAPSNARYKIYMIDEVHMLSNHAFNAMLKTLEEPPEHVKFILATTDPQKIPVTVLSRCLQFNLKQMPPSHIIGHLENILAQEKIEYEAPALRLLAHGAQGSMRDALSLTDQAIAYSAGNITLDAVQAMLGALDQSYLIRVLDALAAGDGAAMLAVADEMAARSLSCNAALQDLGSLLHRIALAQTVPAALPDDLPERDDILRLAGLMQPEDVQLYYQIAVHGRNELGLAPDEYAGFTMTLLRMLAFRPAGAAGPADASSAPPTARPVAANRPGPGASSSAMSATPASKAAMTSAGPPHVAEAGVAMTGATSPAAAVRPASGRPAGGPARAALEAARGASRNAASARPVRPVPSPAPIPVPAAPAMAAPTSQDAPPWEEDDFFDYSGKVEVPAPDHGIDTRVAPVGRQTDATAMHLVADNDVRRSMPAPSANPASSAELPTQAPTPLATETPAMSQPRPRLVDVQAAVRIPGCSSDWPSLAVELPLRGVVQQLALQSELVRCEDADGGLSLRLRVPVDTLCTPGNREKLEAALSAQLGKRVKLDFETGPVTHTANAVANAEREQRQREAEQTINSDPFVQTLMREFGATVVPGSVRPN